MNCSSVFRVLLAYSLLASSWLVQAALDEDSIQVSSTDTPNFGVCGTHEVKTVFSTNETCIYFGMISYSSASPPNGHCYDGFLTYLTDAVGTSPCPSCNTEHFYEGTSNGFRTKEGFEFRSSSQQFLNFHPGRYSLTIKYRSYICYTYLYDSNPDTYITTYFDVVGTTQNQTLTVSKSGTGSGTVTSNPSGISCGSTCSASFSNSTSLTLTANPNSGNTFTGWSGDCYGTSICTVNMTSARNVTATFTAAVATTYDLSVRKTGNGTVTDSSGVIKCGSTCLASFTKGSSAILTATPSSGYTFSGWSGDCYGTGTCTLTMNAARNVTATFTSGTNNDSVITLITYYYQSILGRAPDSGGLAYYQDGINQAKAQGRDVKPEFKTMAYNFLNSPEWLNRGTNNTEYVTTLYKTFLQRDPESAGLTYYLNILANGTSRNSLLDNFVNSPEFDTFMKNLGF